MARTCGWRASTRASARARFSLRLQPVGLCARGVISTALAPFSSAASSARGNMPSSSIATPIAAIPAERSVLMLLRKQGFSTATLSPGTRCETSKRSIASTAPCVTLISKGPGQSGASQPRP